MTSIRVSEETLEKLLARQGTFGFSCNGQGEVWAVLGQGRSSPRQRVLIEDQPVLAAVVSEVLRKRPEGGRFSISADGVSMSADDLAVLKFDFTEETTGDAIAKRLVLREVAQAQREINRIRNRAPGKPIDQSRQDLDRQLSELTPLVRDLGDVDLRGLLKQTQADLRAAFEERYVPDESELRKRIGPTQSGDFEPG